MCNFWFLMCNSVQVCASTIINYMIVALLSISITTFVAMMLHDYSENCMQEKGSALVIPYVGPFQRLASKCSVTRLAHFSISQGACDRYYRFAYWIVPFHISPDSTVLPIQSSHFSPKNIQSGRYSPISIQSSWFSPKIFQFQKNQSKITPWLRPKKIQSQQFQSENYDQQLQSTIMLSN